MVAPDLEPCQESRNREYGSVQAAMSESSLKPKTSLNKYQTRADSIGV